MEKRREHPITNSKKTKTKTEIKNHQLVIELTY